MRKGRKKSSPFPLLFREVIPQAEDVGREVTSNDSHKLARTLLGQWRHELRTENQLGHALSSHLPVLNDLRDGVLLELERVAIT